MPKIKNRENSIDDILLTGGLHRELPYLFDILRDAEFEEKCTAKNHELRLCSTCNSDLNDVMKRINKYEGKLTFLSRPKAGK